MKQLLFIFLFGIGLCLTTSSCATDDASPTAETPAEEPQNLEAETKLNVSYGENLQQVYDLYLPAGRTDTKTKVLILVHGGGWTEGDKADMTYFIPLLQENHPDHAIVNMNYVLAALPGTPAFPNQILDIGSVINKLTTEQENLQIMPEFLLIGVSAGAHLAMVYDYSYDPNDQVKGVVDIVGPADFTDPFYADNPNFELLLNFLVDETAYPANTNFVEVLSPARIVTPNSSPTLMFYGNTDPLVPLTNGERLNTALTNNSVAHSFTVYDGGHGNWNEASQLDLQEQVNAFIETYLPIL